MQISDSSYYPDLPQEESTAALEIDREIFRPHFGNNFMFKFKNGSPLLTIGPHWPFTLCLIMCILAASFLLESIVRQKNNIFWSISTLGSGFLLIVALVFVSLKNPGVNLTLKPVTLTDTSCRACKLDKSPGTVHCTECDICIRGHDHHCPWVGKCVGENNILEFQMFLLSFTFFFTYNLIVIIL